MPHKQIEDRRRWRRAWSAKNRDHLKAQRKARQQVKFAKGIVCSVEGCGRILHQKGFCAAHYARWWRHGDPLKVTRVYYYESRICTVSGCRKAVLARGYCGMHWRRWRVHGKVDPLPRVAQWRLDGSGYVTMLIQAGGFRRRLQQHRVFMEEILGRPLLKTETVHHINGVKNDNRRENLELWSSSQPPGQRVVDKLGWARELIALYDGSLTGGG